LHPRTSARAPSTGAHSATSKAALVVVQPKAAVASLASRSAATTCRKYTGKTAPMTVVYTAELAQS
jgi:hypothetical protein